MIDGVFRARLEGLREALESHGISVAVIFRRQHVFYFTGTLPGSNPAFLVVGERQMAAASPMAIMGVDTVTYVDYDIYRGWQVDVAAAAALDQALATISLGGGKVGAELAHLPGIYLTVLQRTGREIEDVSDLLWSLRRKKDAVELAQIETNIANNDAMFWEVRSALRPGMNDFELWGLVYQTLCRLSGGPFTLEADLGIGLRGANPEAKPANLPLQPGEAVFLDVYSSTHGYYADTTRVFTVGKAGPRQKEVHGVLEAALVAGEAQLRPGVPAHQVDSAVRGTIEHFGFGPNFLHHSGHAYGLFQQEKPYFIPAESMPLEEGMLVTLEPGIYLPGWGGMRLEGNYLIQEGPARRLDHYPSTLTEC